MAAGNAYRLIVEQVLGAYARIPYSHGDIRLETVFDRERDHYLVVSVGWDQRRVYGTVVHVDLIDGKVWIQCDNTEEGVALDLVAAGIPKEHIVLAFRPPEVRPYTEFAVA